MLCLNLDFNRLQLISFHIRTRGLTSSSDQVSSNYTYATDMTDSSHELWSNTQNDLSLIKRFNPGTFAHISSDTKSEKREARSLVHNIRTKKNFLHVLKLNRTFSMFGTPYRRRYPTILVNFLTAIWHIVVPNNISSIVKSFVRCHLCFIPNLS